MDVLKKVVSATGHRTRYVLVTRKISLVLLFSCVRRRDWARALRAVLLRRSILKYRLSRSIPERTKIKQTEKRLADVTGRLFYLSTYCTVQQFPAHSAALFVCLWGVHVKKIYLFVYIIWCIYTQMGDTTKNFCSIPSLVRPGSCSCLDASLRLQNSDWAMIMMHTSFLLTWTLFIVFLLPQRSLATSHWFLKKPRLITNFWISFSCIHFHFPTRAASFFASVVWDAWGRLSSLSSFGPVVSGLDRVQIIGEQQEGLQRLLGGQGQPRPGSRLGHIFSGIGKFRIRGAK